jgi:hypothetical protein
MVEVVFTDEDKKNLKVIAEELPKLRTVVEELAETLEVLSDEKLMKSIDKSLKDLKENKTLNYKKMLEEQKIFVRTIGHRKKIYNKQN